MTVRECSRRNLRNFSQAQSAAVKKKKRISSLTADGERLKPVRQSIRDFR